MIKLPIILSHKDRYAFYNIANKDGGFDLVIAKLSKDAPKGHEFEMAEIVDYFEAERTIFTIRDKRSAKAVIKIMEYGLEHYKDTLVHSRKVVER